jgi:hypothetical protein
MKIYTRLFRKKDVDQSNNFCLVTPLTLSDIISKNYYPNIGRWQINEPESNSTYIFRVSSHLPHEIFQICSQK